MSSPPGDLGDLLIQLLDAFLAQASACHLDGSLVEEVGPLVESESLAAPSAEELVAICYAAERQRLLDFGCGAAHHKPFLEHIGYHWTGVDQISSVASHQQEAVAALSGDVVLYDGGELPFPSGQFDVVYSMLVFQHLRHVDTAFQEIARVMAPGAKLIGQVSQLEQMQDYGTFNMTPFGLKVASAAAGLQLRRVYPKHDVFSFLLRRILITFGSGDDTPLNSMLNPTGYFHTAVAETGHKLALTVQQINLLRVQFCTHYVFEIVKP